MLRSLPPALAILLSLLALLVSSAVARGYWKPLRLSFEIHDVFGVWFDAGVVQFFRGQNIVLEYDKGPAQPPTLRTVEWSSADSAGSLWFFGIPGPRDALDARVLISPWPPLWNSGSIGWIQSNFQTPGGNRMVPTGLNIHTRAVSAWLLLAMLWIYPLWFAIRLIRRPAWAPGACRGCGYDLRASPHRCPECGRANVAELATTTNAPA